MHDDARAYDSLQSKESVRFASNSNYRAKTPREVTTSQNHIITVRYKRST
ncbi:MAG TPA: hypothetical protein DEF41_14470 [Desulfovibrio sp.]|nr:hypothetical protein [Desulfovibrio sp.]